LETWKHVISELVLHLCVGTCLFVLWSQFVKSLTSFSLQEWQCWQLCRAKCKGRISDWKR